MRVSVCVCVYSAEGTTQAGKKENRGLLDIMYQVLRINATEGSLDYCRPASLTLGVLKKSEFISVLK